MLHMEDLADVIKEKPDILIIGKGYSGVMTVPDNLIEKLKAMNIDVRTENSSEAVTMFNAVEGKKKIAALHLTC